MVVIQVPDDVHFVEELALFCQGAGKGKWLDLGGRHLRPKGGYDKRFGYKWHEHPRAHWHLPFLSDGMRLSNGALTLSPRVMLVNVGSTQLQDVRLTGQGKPEEDERNAFLVLGSASAVAAKNVQMERVGLYLWEGAHAQLQDCRLHEGLHGLYVWGTSKVSAVRCHVSNMQGSGFCVTEGATVDLEECTSTASVNGSGIWCGKQCKMTVTACTLADNAQYGVEASYAGSEVTLRGCKIAKNAAGDRDVWAGGAITDEAAPKERH